MKFGEITVYYAVVSTVEEHPDLYLENKNKFFFERQPEISSDKEKSVSMD